MVPLYSLIYIETGQVEVDKCGPGEDTGKVIYKWEPGEETGIG